MTSGRRIVTTIALCLAQILLSNYLYLSHYVVLNLLPLVILSLPESRNINVAMLIAFVAGFVVDFASTGVLGLSSASLLPVAVLRFPILKAVGGEEYMVHRDSPPVGHLTTRGVFLATLSAATVFFLCYVFIDAAGTRPLWFNLTRMALSSVASAALMIFLNRFLFVEK